MSEIRTAVRRLLDSPEAAPFRGAPLAVACSGGADSLALAAAAVHVAHRRGGEVRGLVVDHGLQEGSAEVAAAAAEQLERLGCDGVEVIGVSVTGNGGMEAAARRARYAALRQHRPENGLVLLGHTLDDQAETVLLGLGRGSGPRSIAGMRPLDPPWARPLLGVRRRTTLEACRALGLRPWQDPHNSDLRFTRVRLRTEVLPLLEQVLQGGVREALPLVTEHVLEDGRRLNLLASGRVVNLAAGQGHPAAVMDMSFANQALAAEHMVRNHETLEKKVYDVPREIDAEIARLKLASKGMRIDSLTEAQSKYLASWDQGT